MEKMTTLPEEPVFNIETNLGTIKVKLYSKTPKHRDNFEKLALTGFYDSLLFHRVINGFMIQGGDPYTRDTSAAAVAKYGQGGPGYTIPAEFVPEYTHKKGAIAAARRGDIANPKKESSGSQFYIVQDEKTCAQLDGEYTVFGETISGFDVIDRIASVATNARDLPIKEVRIKKVSLDAPEKQEEAHEEAQK
ncbi:MAG: peptidylprolyl isomerase [Candidatus Cryptobacteroides sp.]